MKYFSLLVYFLGISCQQPNPNRSHFERNGVEIDLKHFESVHCTPVIFVASGLLSGSMLLSGPKNDLPDMKKFEEMKLLHNKIGKSFKVAKKYKDKGLDYDSLLEKSAVASDEALEKMSKDAPELVSYCVEKAHAFKRECYQDPINNNLSQCIDLGDEDLTQSVVDFAHKFYEIEQVKKKK